MGSDTVSSLLFKQPLPLSSISLGRLVRDPLYPDIDYYEPVLDKPLGLDATGAAGQQQPSKEQQAFAPNVGEYRFENFEDTLEAARGTRLELGLLGLLSLSPVSSQASSSTRLRSRLCVVRQLRNVDAFFRAACARDSGTRKWLESEGVRPANGGRVYVVCGFKTLTDATVSHSDRRGNSVDVSADVPVAAIAAAAATGGVPLPLPGNITAAAQTSAGSAERLAYTAPGERVYAVLYRRVRFGWFASRSVDKAYLEKGIRWKSMIGSRSGEDGEAEEDGIEVEISGAPEAVELEGSFESVDIGGEHVIFEDEDETND